MTSCLIATHFQESGFIFSIPPHKVTLDSDKIIPQLLLLHAAQAHFHQPLLGDPVLLPLPRLSGLHQTGSTNQCLPCTGELKSGHSTSNAVSQAPKIFR